MEVGHHKIGVVNVDVQGTISQNDTGQTSRNKRGDQTYGKQHGRVELQISFPKGSDIVKGLYRRWDGDQKSCKRKYRSQEWIHSRNEHMVSPNDGRQEGNGQNGGNHGAVTKNWFSGIGGDDFGGDPQSGQQYNVNLWMTQKPKQVFIQHRRSSLIVQYLTLNKNIG